MTSIWGWISWCSYNLNIFNPSMSDTEILAGWKYTLSHSPHNSQGSLPLDAVPSSRVPSVKQCLPHLYIQNTWRVQKQKNGGKKSFFYPNPYLRPWTTSVFVRIVLPSKWTGVSLKGYRQNLQETAPGEENVNHLTNTTRSDSSILQEVTLQSIVEACTTIKYSTLSAKSDTLSASSSICNKCIT